MKHIVIVDDSKMSLASAKLALEGEYKVTAFSSGSKAVEFLMENTCDLILLDINMPEMDGFEVMGKIHSHEKLADIPIIFLTADTNPKTEAKCLEEGAYDFITKPFALIVMRSRISRILELSDLRKNLSKKTDE